MARPAADPGQQDDVISPAELLSKAAKAERKLLRAEAEAEQRLSDALDRLRQAQKQLDEAKTRYVKRQKAVEEAATALQACQDARAAGPVFDSHSADEQSNGGVDHPVSPERGKSGKKGSRRG